MILCVGTTPTVQRTMTVDRLVIDEVNRASAVHEHASGKSVNVARVLGVLGGAALDFGELSSTELAKVSRVAVGFAGGRRGEQLLEDMDRAGIAHDFVRTAAETRLCTTVIDRAAGQATELVEEAPAASAAEWAALIDRIEARVAGASVMVFSGTLAPGAPVDFCDRWIGRGPVVVVDAKGEAMRRALAARGGRVIAKLNRAELAQTLGERLETEAELYGAMRRAGPVEGWLVVTMGKAGAAAWAEGAMWRVTSPPVEAVSAIGSGDAFAAGLVARMNCGVEAALRLACACGVANALTAYSGWVRREDVERLVGEVRVERV
ncbi:MAG: tagatose-6-phosphate kinase [Phycisphaerales bacterium]|nr:tagatose-6-phosphate kinase [Phycisphaerales bacterium]